MVLHRTNDLHSLYCTFVGANNIDEHHNTGHAGEKLEHCVQRIDRRGAGRETAHRQGIL